MRYNRKFIDARFAMAMEALGVPHGETWTKQADGKYHANIGVHFIDYTPVYGGYRIGCMMNKGGGEHAPFGHTRHNAATFVDILTAIIDTAHILKNKA